MPASGNGGPAGGGYGDSRISVIACRVFPRLFCPRHQPVISRFARLASIVLRPMLASLKATVTSSSLRVSFEVTTIPSPQAAWRTRSPSRNWRSPGMTGRRGFAGSAAGGSAPAGTVAPGLVRAVERVVPGAQRRTRQLPRAGAVGERLALGAEVTRGAERFAGAGAPGGRSPADMPGQSRGPAY